MNLTKLLADVSDASRAISTLSKDTVDRILTKVSEAAIENSEFLITENKKDLASMEESDPLFDRLMLDHDRIKAISSDIKSIALMKSPLGRILSENIRPDGLKISRISLPTTTPPAIRSIRST